MGYFYNYIAKRWNPIDHERKLSRAEQERIARRRVLIEELIAEIEDATDSAAVLYAGLLARTAVTSEQTLMDEYGERVAALTEPDQAQERRRRREEQR